MDGYIQVGATGSVTGDVLPYWLKSVVRNSTGNYTFTCVDNFDAFSWVGFTPVSNNTVETVNWNVETFNAAATGGATFVVQFSVTGSATDLDNNGGLFVDVHIHNYKYSQ
jgi:hypothetical protein